MNIIPWHRRDSFLPSGFDLEDFWDRFLGKTNGDAVSKDVPEFFRSTPFPAVNVAETEDSFCITMDCPGLDKKDFRVEAMGNQLVLSGERKWEDEQEGKEFRRVESRYGSFERSVTLPENTSPDDIEATYKKGVLKVTVPKREKTPTARIPVQVG